MMLDGISETFLSSLQSFSWKRNEKLFSLFIQFRPLGHSLARMFRQSLIHHMYFAIKSNNIEVEIMIQPFFETSPSCLYYFGLFARLFPPFRAILLLRYVAHNTLEVTSSYSHQNIVFSALEEVEWQFVHQEKSFVESSSTY